MSHFFSNDGLAVNLKDFAELSRTDQGSKVLALNSSADGLEFVSMVSADGLDVKGSVRVATTGNITLSGTQTIDGISVSAGNRVLVKDQTEGKEKGIYVVAAGAWSRASDFDDATSVTAGAFTFVEEGSTFADCGFVLTNDGSITVGTTELTFTQFSGAGTYTGGTNITLSGTAFNLDDNISLAGTLDVTGDTSVSTLDSSGATSLATGGGVVNISKTGVMTTVKGTLNVDEAVTLDSTLAVDGTLDVTGDTSVSTLDSTGATSLATAGGVVNISKTGVMTTVKGTLNVDEAVTLDTTLAVTGNTTINGKLIFDINTTTGTTFSKSVNYFTLSSSSDDSKVINSSGCDEGEIIHIFFKNGSSEKLTFDFGTNNLHTGSGTARYLRFSSTGQSATIILINKSSGTWGIINAGAQILTAV